MAGNSDDSGTERGTVVKERHKTQRPRLYKVLFHNDDFTTMDFVIEVLMRFFDKTRTDATRVMLLVHHTGVGLAGTFTREIAETKIVQTTEYARGHGHPLLITMEPE